MNGYEDPISVLHVDDNADFTQLTADLLEQEDDRFTVETADSATEALDRLVGEGYDCIVSDYEMPGRDGIDLLETVRDEYGDVPFILFTGKGSEDIASEAISVGVTDYLQKAVGSDQYTVLANRIRNAVGRAEADRERRHQLEAIETADEGISLLDEDGLYIYVNGAYADLYGYDPREMIGEHWELVYRDEDVEEVEEEILPEVHEVGHWYGTTTGLRADGTTFLEDHNLATTEDGELVCTVRDVDERRTRERDIEEERLLIDTALDHLDDVLYLVGPDGNVRWCNDQFPEMTGFSEQEIVEMDAVEFFPEGERDRIDGAIDEALETGEAVVEAEVLTADGERIPHEFTGDRVTDDGNLVGLVGTGREITKRRGREWRLTALNETGQELMTADSREAIAEIGVEAASDVIGLDANSIHLYDETEGGLAPVARTAAVTDIIGAPPTLKPGESIAWRAFENGEVRAIDDVHEDPDVHNPDSPIRSELYLPIGEHGILIASSESPNDFDTSDIVLGEILMGTTATALDQIDQTEELGERERELRRQNERLEEFASVVSHDLRSPLQVADGNLELLRDERDSPHLDGISEALDRMNQLIDDLLALAREGDHVGDLEPVDVETLASECWQTVETANATLTTEGDLAIEADRSRLQQLLENLVRNAVEHGGPTVTVTIGELDEGFYVEDDGPGLPEDARERAFEFGYSTSDGGTGFGLSIVKQVVDAHGWQIHVTESARGGARYEITNVDAP